MVQERNIGGGKNYCFYKQPKNKQYQQRGEEERETREFQAQFPKIEKKCKE